ncbi:hypothetical protein GGI06_002197 [Coemansia sp. S85]|nr:hypothetical protein GGI06_002197 [Coemansia sp. S85]
MSRPVDLVHGLVDIRNDGSDTRDCEKRRWVGRKPPRRLCHATRPTALRRLDKLRKPCQPLSANKVGGRLARAQRVPQRQLVQLSPPVPSARGMWAELSTGNEKRLHDELKVHQLLRA